MKWSLKLHFRLRLYLLRILSVYYRCLLFFCWGKMLSKTAPYFALVVTGTFSKFLACITVVFLFCLGKWSLKLHFGLRSYLIRILSVYYRRFFFCLGKMVTLTALSVALVIAGTYLESLPRTHVFFSYIFRCHVLASRWYRCMDR